jgi:hypothetical protein
MWADLSTEAWACITVMVLAGGWIIPVTAAAIAKEWRRARESEQLAILKQSMIERGMSVEEMERVLNAGLPDKKGSKERKSSPSHERQSLS